MSPTNILVLNTIADCVNRWTDSISSIHTMIFIIYIIFLFVIFTLMWRKMVSNMKLDIVKALGILNILPTLHFASSPELIAEINKSSLTN